MNNNSYNSKTKEQLDVRHQDAMCTNESEVENHGLQLVKYLLVGIFFGIVITKTEVISWYRIQEMFRFQSFHMFGTIFTAIAVGAVSIFIIKKFNIKTIEGETVRIPDKTFNKGQIYGGLLFGFGWAITGACPGPIYALIAPSGGVAIVILVSAVFGTWVYGYFREKLPH